MIPIEPRHGQNGHADADSWVPDGRPHGTTRRRVYLVDAHPVVRVGLRAVIECQPDLETVGEAVDTAAAARDVPAVRPDVVILDESEPGRAVSAVAEIVAAYPAGRVLILSAHESRANARQLLAAGAVGFVLKRSAPDDIVRAVRVVAYGGIYLDPAVAAAGPLHDGEDGSMALSEREAEVVRLIAQGYSNKEIAARLALSVKTVETYKARSLEKLGVRTRVGIVRYAADRGWLATRTLHASADGHPS